MDTSIKIYRRLIETKLSQKTLIKIYGQIT